MDAIDGKVIILFLGYPACASICPGTMKSLGEMYARNSFPENKVKVVFGNIGLNSEKNAAMRYARSFHSDFSGINLTREELKYLEEEFYLRLYRGRKGEILHPPYTFLLIKKGNTWHVQNIYRSKNLLMEKIQKDAAELL